MIIIYYLGVDRTQHNGPDKTCSNMRVQDGLSEACAHNRPDTTIIEILDSAHRQYYLTCTGKTFDGVLRKKSEITAI